MNLLVVNKDNTEVDDIAIVDTCLAGDSAEFDRLIYKYQKMVFNIAYGILFNYDDAIEVGQDVFIKAYRRLKWFRKESKFSTWLYRMAVNQSISRKRHNKLQDKAICNIGDCESLDLRSPVDNVVKNEMQGYLYTALDKLSSEEKAIINLRDIQELSYEEIAKILGINLGTVKSRLNRARLNLKQKIKKVMKDEV